MRRSCVSPWRVLWCWWHCDPISAGTSGVNLLYKQRQKGTLWLSSGIWGRLYVLVSNTLELEKNWTDTLLCWSLWAFLIAYGITPNIISRQCSYAHHQLASDLQAIGSIRWLSRWITKDTTGRPCVSPWRVSMSWCWWHCDPISAGTSGVNPLYKQRQKGALGLSSGIWGRLYVLVSNTLELEKNWTDTVLYWSLWAFLIAYGITPNII